jgi:hypothetical protein
MRATQTLLAAILGAVFGAALLYGLTLCWAFAVNDLGESAFVVTIVAVLVGALVGGWGGYALARPTGP